VGVVVCLAVVVPLAAAPTPSTLTGEAFSGSGGNFSTCLLATPYSVSGTASGPYAGTFTETGTMSFPTSGGAGVSAAFTITSGTTTITGSESGTIGVGGVTGSGSCADDLTFGSFTGVPYTATIHTPSGNFHDEGTSSVSVTLTDTKVGNAQSESFTSSLSQPVPLAPTSFGQCMNNGWKNFPQFKNQGGCVSFVATGGKNPGGG
jgi:hypothetical protein